MVAVAVYLWVIHSQKLMIATPALVVGLAALLFQRTPLRMPPPLLWFGAFVAWSFVASAGAVRPAEAVTGSWEYAKLGIIFFLVANLAHTRGQVRAFMVLWLGIFALYPVRGTLFNIAFGFGIDGRYAWNFIFENPNDLATLTLPILGMAVAMIPSTKGWMRLAAVIGTALLPGIIFTTQSRGGIVALALTGAVMLWEFRRSAPRTSPTRAERAQQRKRRLAVVALATCAAVGIAFFAPKGVWERLEGLKGVTDTENLQAVDSSADQRFEIWKVSWAIIADHPVFGVGADGYKQVHANYATRSSFDPIARGARDTHSTYFNALAESGVIGFLLLAGMLGSLFATAGRTIAAGGAAADLTRPLRAGLVGFLVACAFATMQHVAFLYVYAGLICLVGTAYGSAPRTGPRPAATR